MTQTGLRQPLFHISRTLLIAAAINLVATSGGLVADEFSQSMQTLLRVEKDYGPYASQRVNNWYQLINDYRDEHPRDKLERVNNFFNQLAFINDSDQWGAEDYWATPVQMLASNGGDCEDFSIAKYFTLREMGVPDDRMRLTYVKALQLDQAHMVLTYYPAPDAEPLVLDNLDTAILPSSKRTDLLPVYSFNGNGLWLARRKGGDERVGHSERLSRWQEVIARVNDEHLLVSR
jgi:predicted transglutaminase-like cysteine proteinase